jgi:hypothetical protein
MKFSPALKKLLLVAALGFLAPHADLSAKSLPNSSPITLDDDESAKNVRLSGKLSVTPGKYKGIRTTPITLTLDRPITVKYLYQPADNGIRKVAVSADVAALEKRLIGLAGKNVSIVGTFSHMLTPHTAEVYFLNVAKILE